MPRAKFNDITLNYSEHGSGSEIILFVHGLLFNHRMFDAQVDALKSGYRCIAVDLRGQGGSEITRGGYDMDSLTEDIRAFIKTLDIAPCHFVGLSMGGFIGLRMAIRYPQLLSSLSLLDTTADPEPRENLFKYHLLAYTGRLFGFRPVISQLMPIMFARQTLEDESLRETVEHW
jgi:pimeloyl-ACP methyl ester carboxylesterase